MEDIRGYLDQDPDYVITGFFTPNYRPVAERLVATLDVLKVPHHIFAVAAADWYSSILLKPAVISRARGLYPNKTILLMDVDCMVWRSLGELMDKLQHCDVSASVCIKPRRTRRYEPEQDRVLAAARVTAWRPTEGAGRLLARWSELCQAGGRHEFGDEGFLMRAISGTPHLIFQTLPREYAGHEITDIGPEAAVVHQTTRQNIPRSIMGQARHALVEKITGKPYEEWRYGIKRLRT